MAKSKKTNSGGSDKKSTKSTAKVVKIEKLDEKNADSPTPVEKNGKQPRVRKTETVRERNQKAVAKAEAKASKQPRRRIRKTASNIAKPLSKPVKIVTWPFRTKPARFIGRIIGRILWPKYFRNSWREIKQVTWPSRRDTWKLTFAVLVFALAFGVAAAGVDYVLNEVIKRIVFRG